MSASTRKSKLCEAPALLGARKRFGVAYLGVHDYCYCLAARRVGLVFEVLMKIIRCASQLG